MKNVILASTSTLHGEPYLAYLLPELRNFFGGITELLFVPYARPGGISHDDYTSLVATTFSGLNIRVNGLHTFSDPVAAISEAQAIFTGGGNTFLLVKMLHEQGLMDPMKAAVEQGTSYLGTSAGSNIGGVNMQNTNDMPIVYPPDFRTMGLIPFNINAHYLNPDPNSKHNGETRETRIKEFHVFNDTPVLGLREGSWIRLSGTEVRTAGSRPSRIFEAGKSPYEVEPGTLLHLA